MPNRRQAITWTNDDPINWRIYATLGGEELIHCSTRITSQYVYCWIHFTEHVSKGIILGMYQQELFPARDRRRYMVTTYIGCAHTHTYVTEYILQLMSTQILCDSEDILQNSCYKYTVVKLHISTKILGGKIDIFWPERKSEGALFMFKWAYIISSA